MPRNRKCYHPGSLIEVCFRTERGLPLVATPYMRVVIESVLARAQSLYPVRIVGFVVMGNHIHLLLIVLKQRDVIRFKEYAKRELAHAINRFQGERNKTVWTSGSDDPPIFDVETAISRMVYLYTNPQSANLEETIEQYPNLNSWSAFLCGGTAQLIRRIPRTSIKKLPKRTLSLSEQQSIADELVSDEEKQFRLVIEPDAWIDCFRDYERADLATLRAEIVTRVRAREAELAKTRRKRVLGAHALRLENIRKSFTPKKWGKRMLCLASSRAVRVRYAAWRRVIDQLAREVYRSWCYGKRDAQLPKGMFWPGGRLSSPCEVLLHTFC